MNKILILSIIGITLLASTVYLMRSKIVAANTDSHALRLYEEWKRQYGKDQELQDEVFRFNVFKENLHKINKFNEENQGRVQLGLNQFADLTRAEFKARYFGYKKSTESFDFDIEFLDEENVPASIDWRTKGAVTAIKNQGQCGSCWAFSTVGGSEGANFLKTGKLVSLSEQQIVDCSTNGGNQGCNGGDLPPAYTYLKSKGSQSEASYPYAAADQDCQYSSKDVVFKPKGFTQVPANNGKQLAAAVAKQPVSVCIEADSDVFQFYQSGVLDSADCGTNLDHCVTNVGYSSSGSQDYWIIKNSWGTTWGIDGYGWILKQNSGEGICGINEEPVYPTY